MKSKRTSKHLIIISIIYIMLNNKWNKDKLSKISRMSKPPPKFAHLQDYLCRMLLDDIYLNDGDRCIDAQVWPALKIFLPAMQPFSQPTRT